MGRRTDFTVDEGDGLNERGEISPLRGRPDKETLIGNISPDIPPHSVSSPDVGLLTNTHTLA